MLKKLIVLFIVLAPAIAFAQEKLAYINTQEVFSQMPEIRDVESKLSAKQEEIKKNLGAIQAEYEKKLDEFKDLGQATDAVAQDQAKQLQQIQERYETYAQNSDKDFSDLRQQLLTPLQQKMQTALKAIGDKHGFTYIFEIGATPYVSPNAVDAGKLVKAELGIK